MGFLEKRRLDQGVAAFTAAVLGGALLKVNPALQLKFFAAGAAQLAGVFTGRPVFRAENGWILPDADLDMVVTTACSASDFFLMVAIVMAWGLVEKGWPIGRAAVGGVVASAPFTLFLNSLRLVVVIQVHRWIGVQLPQSYGPFLHLATGVAIFLPSLIALNGLFHLRSRPASPVAA